MCILGERERKIERDYRRIGILEEEEWNCLEFHVSGSQSNDSFRSILEKGKLLVAWQIPLCGAAHVADGRSAFMKPNSHFLHIPKAESTNSAPCLLDNIPFLFCWWVGWVNLPSTSWLNLISDFSVSSQQQGWGVCHAWSAGSGNGRADDKDGWWDLCFIKVDENKMGEAERDRGCR